jgi:hypothetical protein
MNNMSHAAALLDSTIQLTSLLVGTAWLVSILSRPRRRPRAPVASACPVLRPQPLYYPHPRRGVRCATAQDGRGSE